MTEAFTLAAYEDMLRSFLQRGYAAVDYRNLVPQSKHLILRHDIDFSLDYAPPLAGIEAALGLTAWYFVLMRSEFYNPYAPRNKASIRALLSQGHQVGLHFDAAIYNNDPTKFDAAAAVECSRLEDLTGAQVTMVSFHRPAKTLLNYAAPLGGRLHSYMPQFFSAIGYCSDSRGVWKEHHPLEHPSVRDGTALQLLTHPLWWNLPGADATAKLTHWGHNQRRYLEEELARHCSAYVLPAAASAA